MPLLSGPAINRISSSRISTSWSSPTPSRCPTRRVPASGSAPCHRQTAGRHHLRISNEESVSSLFRVKYSIRAGGRKPAGTPPIWSRSGDPTWSSCNDTIQFNAKEAQKCRVQCRPRLRRAGSVPSSSVPVSRSRSPLITTRSSHACATGLHSSVLSMNLDGVDQSAVTKGHPIGTSTKQLVLHLDFQR